MSSLDALNIRITTQRAERRKRAFQQLAFTLAVVLALLLTFLGLEYIGFISELFQLILISFTICAGAFKSGYIWRDVKW